MFLSTPASMEKPPVRIVSLVPSQTELLHYLQLDMETVGITKFCIHPTDWFKHKIRVGGTKTVDLNKVKDLRPDLIIANKEENVREQVQLLADLYPVWLTNVDNLQDAQEMITDIGQLTNRPLQAATLVNLIDEKFLQLQGSIRAASIGNGNSTNPLKVCYLIWKDPYMTVGSDTFINDMLEKAGFQNTFATASRYPAVSLQEIQASNCDVVMLSSEPYPFKNQHIQELESELPGKKVVLVNGEMFSWYGSRLLLAADYLQELHRQFSQKQ